MGDVDGKLPHVWETPLTGLSPFLLADVDFFPFFVNSFRVLVRVFLFFLSNVYIFFVVNLYNVYDHIIFAYLSY